MDRVSIRLTQHVPPEVQLGAAELTPVAEPSGEVIDFDVVGIVEPGREPPTAGRLSDIVEQEGFAVLLDRLVAVWTSGTDAALVVEIDGASQIVHLNVRPERLVALWIDCRSLGFDAEAELTIDLSSQDRPGLSRREIDILELVAEGATTREIAERLYLSVHTIRNHVRRILTKLGARSRSEAVATALTNHLIELPSPSLRRR